MATFYTDTASIELLSVTNLTAQTSSIQYFTSSQFDVGTNLITLNTTSPLRYGGLAVADSGSTPITSGSLLFDSQNNQWIFVHQQDPGSPSTSSVLIMGPQTFNDLGNEITLGTNRLTKGSGGDLGEHITSSNVTDTGVLVSINSNTEVTGSLKVTAGITASLQGTATTASYVVTAQTASYIVTAQTASYVLQAVSASFASTASYVNPLTQTLQLTGSILVNSPNVTTGQFVGNQNGYAEFSIRNTNTGISASGDIAVYADNGTATNNYIDMGINNSGLSNTYFYGGIDLGNALDAYLFNVGGDLRIGNGTSTSPSQSLYLFSNPSGIPDLTITGSKIGIQKSSSLNATLDVNGNAIISGSLSATGNISGSFIGNGSGLTGITATSSPAGPDQAIQYRTGSITTGSANLTFNNSRLSITGSAIITSSLTPSLFLNTSSYNSTQPPVIVISQPNTASFNTLTSYGNTNNYLQLNHQNFSSGPSSSTDYVATNDIGTETTYFVNMGINSSGYVNNGNGIGTGSDAYLYSTGRALYIGNASTGPNANTYLFSGTTPTPGGVGTDIFISSSGQVGISTITPAFSLDVSGSLRVSDYIEGMHGKILAITNIMYF